MLISPSNTVTAGPLRYTGAPSPAQAMDSSPPRAETRMTAGLREWTPEQLERRDPEWIASFVTWLASPLASYVTGQAINVDGGIAKGLL